MKMKFLAPPLSVAALLLGLSYVDASPDEFVIRAPAEIIEMNSGAREVAMDSVSFNTNETSSLPDDTAQAAL